MISSNIAVKFEHIVLLFSSDFYSFQSNKHIININESNLQYVFHYEPIGLANLMFLTIVIS